MHLFRPLFAAGASSACFVLVLLANCSDAAPPLEPGPDAALDGAARVDAAPPDAGSDAALSPDGAAAGSCAQYAKAYCARLAVCAPGFFFPGQYLDAAACEDTNAARCALERAAPGIAVEADDLRACSDDLASFSCSKLLARALPDSCGTRGTAAIGSPCGSDLQCATGFCATTTSACGTCAEKPALGAACVGGRCGAGATCSEGIGDDRRCVSLALEIGEACGETSYCRFGLSCVQGRCAAGLAEGAACSFGAPDRPDCDVLGGLRCNGFTADAVCVRPTYVDIGATCGNHEIDTDAGLMLEPLVCRADGTCPMGPGDNTCLPRGALGQACDESLEVPCRTQLSCVAGRCVLADPGACR